MADLSASGRRQSAQRNRAMPGGRFPIENEADLRRAIQAVGRAQGGEQGRRAVRRFIIRRARTLGASQLIPGNWNPDGSLKS